MTDMLTRQFLTVREVGDLLKVGEVSVRHWIRGGELRAIDIGREWRIAPSDLEHFLLCRASLPRRVGVTVGVGSNIVLEPFQDAADRAVDLLSGGERLERTSIPNIETEEKAVA